MKKYIGIVLVGLSLVACNPETENESVEALIAKRDSLKEKQVEIAESLVNLENELSKLQGKEVSKTVVTSSKVSQMTFEHYFTIHGVVETDKNAKVYPDAAGKITKLLVKEGDRVKKGQVIAELYADVMESSIEEVRTQFKLAKDAYEKQKRLWDQQIGSEMQFLQAETNYKALAQKLETLGGKRDMYKVVAPFDGILDELFPKVGEMAAPQMPFCRVINLKSMFVEADVSEDYINSVKRGSKVVIEFGSTGDVMVSRVSRVGNYINPNNRTFKIRIELSNQDGKLKPNLLADLKIMDYSKKEAIVLPPSIIQQDRNNQEYVYILVDNKVNRLNVTTGMTYGNNTIVLSGLTGSEEYIVKGARSVQEGDEVVVKNS